MGRVAAAAGMVWAGWAAAVDLNAIGSIDRRRYCLAYVFLDAQAQLQAGAIDERGFSQTGKAIANQLRRGTRNIEAEYRGVDRAVGAILAERAPLSEIAEKARVCREALNM